MNAVEIEEAVSALAAAPFDAEFPFGFLAAFGNKEVTLKRLRARSSNLSDIPGGVLRDPRSENNHEVVGQLFRAMGTPTRHRAAGGIRPWADGFPFVNGGLCTSDGEFTGRNTFIGFT